MRSGFRVEGLGYPPTHTENDERLTPAAPLLARTAGGVHADRARAKVPFGRALGFRV